MKINCSHTELVGIDLLVPNPKNRNEHTEEQLNLLAKIMKHQGWRSPIVVSKRSGFMTKGHGRLESAKRNGWVQVPVDFQDYDNEAQEYQDMIADNEIARLAKTNLSEVLKDVLDFGPDFDFDLLGIPDFKLPEDFTPQSDEDSIPEKVETRAKPGDIYQLGRHRLMCGDSLDIHSTDRLIAGQPIDLMFTDPPYGISIVNVGASSKMGFVGAVNSPSPLAGARAYKPVIGDDKDFDPSALFAILCTTRILWGANCYASRLPDNPQWLVWDKKLEDGGMDHNNFSDCELAWTDAKGKAVKIYRHVWAGMLRHGSRKEEMVERVHPTQKPVGLCGQIIKDFSSDNMSILDLFGGSGSTLIACEKTNRKCFMMELDPHYCDVITSRWEKYTGKTAELIS